MVACDCKEYDMKGIRGRETGQSPFLLKLLRRRHGMASSWRFDAMRIHETPRRGHEGRASGVVFFFRRRLRFFLASGDCGARLPAPRRGNNALYSRAYFFGGQGLPRAVKGSSGQVARRDRRVNLGFNMGWWAYLVLGRVFSPMGKRVQGLLEHTHTRVLDG